MDRGSGGNSAQREAASEAHLCPQLNLPGWRGQDEALHSLGARKGFALEAPDNPRSRGPGCSREVPTAASTRAKPPHPPGPCRLATLAGAPASPHLWPGPVGDDLAAAAGEGSQMSVPTKVGTTSSGGRKDPVA